MKKPRITSFSDRSKSYILKTKLKKKLPSDAPDYELIFYGPEVLLFTKDVGYFLNNEQKIKTLAQGFRVRIKIRSIPDSRASEEKVIDELSKKVENIKDYKIWFDHNLGEVHIEVPSEIYGKIDPKTIKNIFRQTGWYIVLHRRPLLQSSVSNILSQIINTYQDEIFKNLKKVGEKIRKPAKKTKLWSWLLSLGGYQEVGRSCHHIQTQNSSLLIDCGVNVGTSERSERYPYLEAIRAKITQSDIDSLVITHAHLDHIGFVPWLYRMGLDIPIYTTEPTRDLMLLLLTDFIEVSEKNGQPLEYEKEDVIKTIKYTIPCKYKEVYDVSPDMRVTFFNAGHILGASIVHIHIGEGDYNLVIANDFKLSGTSVLGPSDLGSITHINGMVLEATYGGANDVSIGREEADKSLVEEILKTKEKNGKILIPVFAVGRAQEILYSIVRKREEIGEIKVYIDGMVKEATAIYTKYPEYLSKPVAEEIRSGKNPFLDEFMETINTDEEREEIVKNDEPCIIIASSGMLVGGPSLEYFLKLCEDEKNKVIFVGYQAIGTLGRRLIDGERKITVTENEKRILKDVKLDIVSLKGFSGHSDRKELERSVSMFKDKLEKLILCHGEPEKIESLSKKFSRQKSFKVYTPNNLEGVRLR